MLYTHPEPTSRQWTTLRILFRVLSSSILAWLFLAILWAGLPFPGAEYGSRYASSILQAGKTLTRVYPSNGWRIPTNDRLGFELSYKLHQDLTPYLTLSGSATPLPLFHPNVTRTHSELTQSFQAIARTGDTDGANLPWFPFADSVLLFWQIHRESIPVELEAQWRHLSDAMGGEIENRHGPIQQLDIGLLDKRNSDPLISIRITDSGNPGREWAKVDSVVLGDGSASPSWTYGIRSCIIYVLAPTTVFVNDWLGEIIPIGLSAVNVAFAVFVFVFIIGAVVVSLWRCIGGPDLESMVERLRVVIQGVERRYPQMRAGALEERVNSIYQSRKMQVVLRICREGWHPERKTENIEERIQEEDKSYEDDVSVPSTYYKV